MYENLLAAASQDTLFSLQQIDPLPMESTLDLEKLDLEKQDLPPPPTPSPLSRASTLGLSGGGHGKAYYRKYRLSRLLKYVAFRAARINPSKSRVRNLMSWNKQRTSEY